MSTQNQLDGRSVTVPHLNATLEISRLICSVYDAVQQVNWPASGRSLNADPTPDAVLQSVLTYCYAVGILESTEIAAAAENDPAVEYLCANYRPTAQTIREYRRRHVPYFKMSLVALFRTLAAAAPESYSSLAFERLVRCSPNYNFPSLAAERLSSAVRADSHALDV